MPIKIIATLTLFLAIEAHAVVYVAGDISSTGGDSLVMAFTIAGQKACGYLKLNAKSNSSNVDAELFCRAVSEIRVSSAERTFLKDVEVDAINNRVTKTIVLSQARNKSLNMQSLKQLAVHEYLAVSGVDDSGYKVSGPIAAKLSEVTDYFPVRYCEVAMHLQAGYAHKRYKDRGFLNVKFKTDFPQQTDAGFWFDFRKPSPLWKEKANGKDLDVIGKLNLLGKEEKCFDVVQQNNQKPAQVCLSSEGPKDLIREYLKSSEYPKVLVSMKLSQLRSVQDVQFISPNDSNLSPEFMQASGYFDPLGFQGTKLYFTKRYFNDRPTDNDLTFGSEFFNVTCY